MFLSENFYNQDDLGVTCTLCFGVQWDAILDFVKDESHSVTNSLKWGNYGNSTYTINRMTAKYCTNPWIGDEWITVGSDGYMKEKESDKRVLLTTGASDEFAAKNIYDIAGNVGELTFEIDNGGGYYASFDIVLFTRGYDEHDYNGGASMRAGIGIGNTSGFRPALYIND